ncbi:MAG: helix-turn-helix transcriptional regulator [Bacilli bacterium]
MGINEFIKIGDYLKKIRLDNNLTQEDFAKRLNIKRSTYAHYEKNVREPTKDTLDIIANEFNVDIVELISTDNSKTKKLTSSKKAEELFKKFLDEYYKDELINGYEIITPSSGEHNYLLKHCYSFFHEFYKYRDSRSPEIQFIKNTLDELYNQKN